MKKWIIIRLIIVGIMFLLGLILYDKLPDLVPIHWWFDWQADRYWSKIVQVIMIPGITLLITLLFPILAKIDPKKQNYEKFLNTWEILQYAIVIFMAYIYFVSMYMIFKPDANINTFIMMWMWVLFMILWNYMWKIKQNFFAWIKVPWTLDNEEVWNKTHRFWWKIFFLAWLIFIIMWIFWYMSRILFIIIILCVALLPIIYSYIIYKKITKK